MNLEDEVPTQDSLPLPLPLPLPSLSGRGQRRGQGLALMGALVFLVGTGCSSIPEGGDPAAKVRASPADSPKLGRIGVAPVASVSLSPDEKTNHRWDALDVFNEQKRATIQKDFVSALTATQSFDEVRLAATDDHHESFAARDKYLVTIAIENVSIEGYRPVGLWAANILNWVFWIAPSWFVASDRYTLNLSAKIRVLSGDSGRELVEAPPVFAAAKGDFDEFDCGFRFTGFIYPNNDRENWITIAQRLLPAARQDLAAAVAQKVDEVLRQAANQKEVQEAQKKTLVVALGITNYADDRRYPPVESAAADAREVVDTLLAGGVKPDHRVVLLDSSATGEATRKVLKEHLARADDGDTVFVYFAGYGTRSANGQPRLLLHDGNELALDELAQLLAAAKGTKLVVIDAGFDGKGRSVKGGIAPADASETDLKPLGDVPTLAAIVAAGAGETALAVADLEHGLLTYYLIHALQGEADEDKDLRLTAKEVYGFVRTKVVSEAALLGDPETPRGVGLDRSFGFDKICKTGETK